MKHETQFLTVDELSTRFLSPEVRNAFPRVEVGVKDVGMGFELDRLELKGLRISAQIHEVVVAVVIAAVWLTSLATSVGFILFLLAGK